MSLPRLIASSRLLLNANNGPAFRIDPPTVIKRASEKCDALLDRRRQSVSLVNMDRTALCRLDREQLVELLADAICDFSGLTRRGKLIVVTFDQRTIRFSSSHPIDIPENTLAINDRFRNVAYRLKVNVTLSWEQGRGPSLVLMLPKSSGRVKAAVRRSDEFARPSKARKNDGNSGPEH